MSAQKPSTNRVIDYWPSWSDWSRKSLEEYKKTGKKGNVDVINIAFALPEKDGTLRWTDVDKSNGGNYQKTIDVIKALRAEGKQVLIAVGGATAHDWNLKTPADIKKLAENIKKFVDEYGLNGVDIDYEMTDANERVKVADLIIELRKIMPQNQYTLSYAAWSIGAYGKNNPGHEHAEWADNSNVGIDIALLKKAGHLLDYVNVMSYDAFAPNKNYNPIQAIEAYRSLLNGQASKVILGIELGLHGWPHDDRTSKEDAEAWIKYAIANGFGGVMFWTLEKDVQKETLKPDGSFLALCKQLMPKSGLLSPIAKADIDLKHAKEYTKGHGAKEQSEQASKNKPVTSAGSAASAWSPANEGSSGSAATATAAAPKPHVTAPDKKQNKDQPKQPLQVITAFHLQHTKNQKMDAKTVFEKLGIQDLLEGNKEKVLQAYETHVEQFEKLKQALLSQKTQRDNQIKEMKNFPQEQIAELKKQYALQDEQDAKHLKTVEETLNGQLKHFIKQLRDTEQATRRPPNPAG